MSLPYSIILLKYLSALDLSSLVCTCTSGKRFFSPELLERKKQHKIFIDHIQRTISSGFYLTTKKILFYGDELTRQQVVEETFLNYEKKGKQFIILINGPPSSGKTSFANYLCRNSSLVVLNVRGLLHSDVELNEIISRSLKVPKLKLSSQLSLVQEKFGRIIIVIDDLEHLQSIIWKKNFNILFDGQHDLSLIFTTYHSDTSKFFDKKLQSRMNNFCNVTKFTFRNKRFNQFQDFFYFYFMHAVHDFLCIQDALHWKKKMNYLVYQSKFGISLFQMLEENGSTLNNLKNILLSDSLNWKNNFSETNISQLALQYLQNTPLAILMKSLTILEIKCLVLILIGYNQIRKVDDVLKLAGKLEEHLLTNKNIVLDVFRKLDSRGLFIDEKLTYHPSIIKQYLTKCGILSCLPTAYEIEIKYNFY